MIDTPWTLDDRLYVFLTDPSKARTTIGGDILDAIRDGESRIATLDGDILRIQRRHPTVNPGGEGVVIYRIGEKVPDLFAYYAEFPD